MLEKLKNHLSPKNIKKYVVPVGEAFLALATNTNEAPTLYQFEVVPDVEDARWEPDEGRYFFRLDNVRAEDQQCNLSGIRFKERGAPDWQMQLALSPTCQFDMNTPPNPHDDHYRLPDVNSTRRCATFEGEAFDSEGNTSVPVEASACFLDGLIAEEVQPQPDPIVGLEK